jgi:hypothetical protein
MFYMLGEEAKHSCLEENYPSSFSEVKWFQGQGVELAAFLPCATNMSL